MKKDPPAGASGAEDVLYLSGFAEDSRVNGPGRRIVVWVQGCTLACPGCFNPGTHEPGGNAVTVAALAHRILSARRSGTAGVTFSGGEPFQQASALAQVASTIRSGWPDASLLAFSGYRFEELRRPDAPPGASALIGQLDLLIDGRFDPRRPGRQAWRGSRNQRLWVLGRPAPRERPPGLTSELHIAEDGQVLLSGFPDARLRRAIKQLE